MPLSLQFSAAHAASVGVDALVVGVLAGDIANDSELRELDAALNGALFKLVKAQEFQGKPEQTLELTTLGHLKAARVLLLGMGGESDLTSARLRSLAAVAARWAQGCQVTRLGFVLPVVPNVRALAEGLGLGAYRFSKYFTGDRQPKTDLVEVLLLNRQRVTPAVKRELKLGLAVAEAVGLARDAVNEPPNEFYPETMAELARKLAKQYKFKLKVLDKAGIQRAGMKLHYAVGQGSANEPRFIHLTYTPAGRARKKLVFVGKGLTFDSGGLCIKPAPGMGEMKSDMGGAAAVLGLMKAVGEVKPDVEVHCVIGAAENMPDAAAYRPGDIFGSLDGKSVEIINTDAEGRLVLADALAYARRLKPSLIVDAATLTGACLVALGKTCSAYYSADDELAERFGDAAKEAGENFWRMPLLDELGDQLKSDVADLKHTGDRWGGSITAALFLREFVGDVPWIHCDIAGAVLADRAQGYYPKGGTGHPVLTFLRFVEACT